MKTKNFLLTGALLIVALFSVNGVMAEATTTSNKSAQTTVNIILKGIQSIEVSNDEVTMTYSTIEDYTGGVEGDKTPVLTVNSSGKFAVNVKSAGTFFDKLTAGAVTINATPEKEGAPNGEAVLNTGEAVTAKVFIPSTAGGFALKYDLEFSHKFSSNKDAFANSITELTNGDTHTATVVYEIIPG